MLFAIPVTVLVIVFTIICLAVRYLHTRIEYYASNRLHVRNNFGRLSVRFNTSIELNDWLLNLPAERDDFELN